MWTMISPIVPPEDAPCMERSDPRYRFLFGILVVTKKTRVTSNQYLESYDLAFLDSERALSLLM